MVTIDAAWMGASPKRDAERARRSRASGGTCPVGPTRAAARAARSQRGSVRDSGGGVSVGERCAGWGWNGNGLIGSGVIWRGFGQRVDRTDGGCRLDPAGNAGEDAPEERGLGTTENQIERIATGLGDAEIVARLERLSKNGKLAGFEAGGEGGVLASFAAHGTPFEGRVEITRDGAGAVSFGLVMPGRGAVIFAAVLALTVWPGLPITEGFLQSMVWYERLTSGWFATWMWYVPVTALPAPFAVRSAVRRSRATALEHAREVIDRLHAGVLDAG